MHTKRNILVLASLIVSTLSVSLITANILRRDSTRKASFFTIGRSPASIITQEPTWSLPETGATAETPAPAGQNCTYSLYYWLENKDRWPEQVSLGGLAYSRDEAERYLTASPDPLKPEDAFAVLYRQLYTAYLNIHAGASWANLEGTLNDANAWMRDHPPGSQLSQFNQQRGIDLASVLEKYNNGEIHPGPCPGQPAVPTPTSTSIPSIPDVGPVPRPKNRSNPAPIPTNPPPPENTPTPLPTNPPLKETEPPKPTKTTQPDEGGGVKPTKVPKPTKTPKK